METKTETLYVHNLLPAPVFEDRPELESLCDWWRKKKGGVITLSGIGGTGKTALVDRFLRLIPDLIPLGPEGYKDESLKPPTKLLVFSFYQSQEIINFFEKLYAWLKGLPLDPFNSLSYTQIVLELQSGVFKSDDRVLLILDGMELVQSSEKGPNFGQLLDDDLKDFLIRIAKGSLPSLSAIITTRFPLPDFHEEQCPNYYFVSVGNMPEIALIRLFRNKGVRGSDDTLKELVRKSGHHAMTANIVAGYIVHFKDGEPVAGFEILPDEEVLDREISDEMDQQRRSVLRQQKRLLRVGQRYRETLENQDPLALSVLESVCFSYREIDSDEIVTRLDIGKDREKFWKNLFPIGSIISKDSKIFKVNKTLDWLFSLGIIQKTSGNKYAAHVAIREPFIRGMSPELERLAHQTAMQAILLYLPHDYQAVNPKELIQRFSIAPLIGIPINYPNDTSLIYSLTEIVYHMIEIEDTDSAWDFYKYVIGGYQILSRKWEMLKIGENLLSSLLSKFFNYKGIDLSSEYSRYLETLGHLRRALEFYYSSGTMFQSQGQYYKVSESMYKISRILLHCGSLLTAKDVIKRAHDIINANKYAYIGEDNRSLRAERSDHLIGELGSYLDFLMGVNTTLTDIWSYHPIEWCHAALHIGKFREAIQMCQIELERLRGARAGLNETQWTSWQLQYAECLRLTGEIDESENVLHQVTKWFREDYSSYNVSLRLLYTARLKISKHLRHYDVSPAWVYELLIEEAMQDLLQGLDIAKHANYNLLCIDFLLEISHIKILQMDFVSSIYFSSLALEGHGFQEEAIRALGLSCPPGELLTLIHQIVSTNPDDVYGYEIGIHGCKSSSYAWGEAAARHLFGEALLRYICFESGLKQLRCDDNALVKEDMKLLLKRANSELLQSRLLRYKMQDPKIDATDSLIKEGVVVKELRGSRTTRRANVSMEKPIKSEQLLGEAAMEVGILIPLREEFRELYSRLHDYSVVSEEETGSSDYLFFSQGTKRAYKCAATFVGSMGPSKAALATERFITRRQPKTIVILGIAGALDEDIKLGDVVLAHYVDQYAEHAKAIPGTGGTADTFELQPGGTPYHCSQDLVQKAMNFEFVHQDKFAAWLQDTRDNVRRFIPEQEVKALEEKNLLLKQAILHDGPIASGPVVGAAQAFATWLKRVKRDYKALEMEGGGVLSAIYTHADPKKSIILRGISDFADERKKELDHIGKGGIRRYAMNNVIELLWRLLDAGILPH